MLTQAQTFLSEIDNFLTRTGMTASAFGRGAVNDPSFVRDVRQGRMPNLRLVERVHQFMRQHDVEQVAS